MHIALIAIFGVALAVALFVVLLLWASAHADYDDELDLAETHVDAGLAAASAALAPEAEAVAAKVEGEAISAVEAAAPAIEAKIETAATAAIPAAARAL